MKFHKEYIAIYNPKIVSFFGLLAAGMSQQAQMAALFPFIFFRDRSQDVLDSWQVRHELIHFRQQIETLFVGMFLVKWFETLRGIFLGKNKQERYFRSAFEQEAYLNHNDSEYLRKRKLFTWRKYLKNKKNFKNDPVTGEITFL